MPEKIDGITRLLSPFQRLLLSGLWEILLCVTSADPPSTLRQKIIPIRHRLYEAGTNGRIIGGDDGAGI
jgi:hypothetical protein